MGSIKAELSKATTNPEFRCITVLLDVKNEGSLKNMVTETVKEFGRIDYAVNCAGVGLKKPFTEMEMKDWGEMIGNNLTGVFCCVKEEALQMMKQEQRQNSRLVAHTHPSTRSIVNIASLAGVSGLRHSGTYAAAKHGVVGITKTMALDYPEVKCNAVIPCYTKTPLMSALGEMGTNALEKTNNWTLMKDLDSRRRLPKQMFGFWAIV